MRQPSTLYKRHRFPGELISHAVWLYYRFLLSYRDVEELLAERGVAVSYETIRRWCRKFGQPFADGVRRQRATAIPTRGDGHPRFDRLHGRTSCALQVVQQHGVPDVLAWEPVALVQRRWLVHHRVLQLSADHAPAR